MTHKLIADNNIILITGVFDVLSAKIAERVGFHAVVVTGFGVSASYLGEPDFGLLTQSEIMDTARRICNAVNIGVIVDGDTGFGGALNVQRMVKECIRMGVIGILLEDQTWPKRCGHMKGKSVVPMEEHVQKIKAAVDARGNTQFIITARTDAREPMGLDEAIRRGKAYKEAGADVIFIEAPKTIEELEKIASEVPGPLTVNCIEGGATPTLTLERYHEMGFTSVGYVLSGLFASARALDRTYRHLIENGSTDDIREEMMDFEEFIDLIGVKKKYNLDEKYKSR
ncbi:MAG: oxaloacetate decarboxylase [Deltaproteobacteria bacterium]|nr:oxaloacetate decarboxylase [Deltaproteobacteria bacterium]